MKCPICQANMMGTTCYHQPSDLGKRIEYLEYNDEVMRNQQKSDIEKMCNDAKTIERLKYENLKFKKIIAAGIKPKWRGKKVK